MGPKHPGEIVGASPERRSKAPPTLKKKLQWHTTFGLITIEQQILRNPPKGSRIHPFRDFAKVTHRGCSRVLQRRIVDFSAERSFAQTALALKEHYQIEIPIYRIDTATSEVCKKAKAHNSQKPENLVEAENLISQTDGSMLPIISTQVPENTAETDRRKHRKCHWKELRISTVSDPTMAASYYGVALGEPYTIGCMMHEICLFKGMTEQTQIHAVSDGAPWIADQYQRHFGTQSHFLLDFFHACDYLVQAVYGTALDLEKRNKWLEKCKNLLRESRAKEVIEAIEKLPSKPSEESKKAILGAANYLRKREEKGQLDYRAALEKGLPIGSGEVESAHRHLLQKRLKIAGAWWSLERAEEMAQLRVLRANERWEELWQSEAA